MSPFNCYFTNAEHEELDILTARTGLSKAQLIREAVDQYLRQRLRRTSSGRKRSETVRVTNEK